jgi:dTDP-4-amino-4,6-dideoxygalactose transaminase
VLAALDDPILTTGRRVAEAEQAFAEYLAIPNIVALDSCTAALHLALMAHGIGPGDEVIVPAMTFVATANAALMCGATPVIADVDPQTGCLTPATAAAKITDRTRAIIPVHLYGQLCDMVGFRALADAHHVILIEDSAHCVEARHGGVRPGSHSDCACFSFYATKNLTCGEGGALATRDAELAACVRRLAQHGITSTAYDRYGQRYRHWDMPGWGWKYNLDNIRASLLVPQIKRLDRQWRRRQEIADRYEAGFAGVEGVAFPQVTARDASARHLFTIWVDPQRRDAILTEIQARGVGVTVNYRAIHLLEYFATTYGYARGDLPAAESIGDRTISVPLYTQLTDDQVRHVIDVVTDIVGAGALAPVGAGHV